MAPPATPARGGELRGDGPDQTTLHPRPAALRWSPVEAHGLRNGPGWAWQRPVGGHGGRPSPLITLASPSPQSVGGDDADRRRDVQLVGIGLGVWVLLMLVVVQWA
jgi:hypothetical protein